MDQSIVKNVYSDRHGQCHRNASICLQSGAGYRSPKCLGYLIVELIFSQKTYVKTAKNSLLVGDHLCIYWVLKKFL